MTKTNKGFIGQFAFLSNFAPFGFFDLDMGWWPTSEHYYQAMKTKDETWRKLIQNVSTPGKAKKLGKQAPLIPNWHDIKLDIMNTAISYKFHQNPDIQARLIFTEGIELIEVNQWGDTFWGECGGIGENHLGKLLMKIRDKYIEKT